MDHGNDALEALQFVPLVAIDTQLVLPSREWTHIPGDIVAPADGLNPVDASRINPYKISWPL